MKTTWKIEMRLAHLKHMLRLGRLRLRGPRGVRDEFVLAASPRTGDNLQRWSRDREPSVFFRRNEYDG